MILARSRMLLLGFGRTGGPFVPVDFKDERGYVFCSRGEVGKYVMLQMKKEKEKGTFPLYSIVSV